MSIQPVCRKRNEKRPLISFVITYYNEPVGMLKQCISSVLSLSLKEDESEIIVVDDGSDTSPLGFLGDYTDRILYVRQKNGGLSKARNAGIELAHGVFLQFVDADDHLIRPAYEQCIDLIRYKNADVVLFHTTHKEVEETPFSGSGPMTGSEYMRCNNLRASACGYLFRRSLLLDLRFPVGLLHEDEAFTPQLLLRADRVYSTEARAYYYRKRSESITHRTDIRTTLKRFMDIERIIISLSEEADRLPSNDRAALQRRVAQLTMDYLYNIMMKTRNHSFLNHALERLSRRGLFPLPKRDYTLKYKAFSRLINVKAGRKMLMWLLPPSE